MENTGWGHCGLLVIGGAEEATSIRRGSGRAGFLWREESCAPPAPWFGEIFCFSVHSMTQKSLVGASLLNIQLVILLVLHELLQDHRTTVKEGVDDCHCGTELSWERVGLSEGIFGHRLSHLKFYLAFFPLLLWC